MLILPKTYFMDKDFRKIVFDPRWRRLRKYNKDVLALRYATLKKEVERIAAMTNIPQSCVEAAFNLAVKLVGSGYSPQALAAAALIMACRIMKMPRPLSDFESYIENIEKAKRILRELSTLIKNTPKLEHYVAIIVARTNTSPQIAKMAIELLRKNRKSLQGRNPWAAAAAALWLSGVEMNLLQQFASTSAIKNIARILK